MEGCRLNENIRFVDLSHNEITAEGCKHIRDFLAYSNTLQVLFLHWNLFGAVGGTYIANSLTKNTTLLVLDMSFCNMGHSKVADLTMPTFKTSEGDKKGKKKKDKSKEKDKEQPKEKKKGGSKSKSPNKKFKA